MKKETIRKLVLSAMFAALCCVATLVVQIPIATGYLNIGEGMCLLSGLVLGPWYGMAAAGLGSGTWQRACRSAGGLRRLCARDAHHQGARCADGGAVLPAAPGELKLALKK